MSPEENINTKLSNILKASILSNHRSLLIISGGMDWCHLQVEQVMKGWLAAGERLWVGDRQAPGIETTKAGKARQWLGRGAGSAGV